MPWGFIWNSPTLSVSIYRYLHGNCQETRQRRVEVYKLKDRIDKLSKKLKRLQIVINFMYNVNAIIIIINIIHHKYYYYVMLVTFLLSKCSFTNYNHTPVSLVEVLSLALKFVGSRDQIEGNGYDDEGPTPRSGSASDIITVESSLQQWKTEMESDIWGQFNETLMYGIHVKHTM